MNLRKDEITLLEDPVTITVVQTEARSTFRYWQLFLHQIVTTLQVGLVFFISISDEVILPISFILCYVVLGLTVVSLVLTYLYSTDTFIMVFLVFLTLCLHRQYPHQVPSAPPHHLSSPDDGVPGLSAEEQACCPRCPCWW